MVLCEINVLSKTLTKISCDFVIFDVLRIEFSFPSKIDVYFRTIFYLVAIEVSVGLNECVVLYLINWPNGQQVQCPCNVTLITDQYIQNFYCKVLHKINGQTNFGKQILGTNAFLIKLEINQPYFIVILSFSGIYTI